MGGPRKLPLTQGDEKRDVPTCAHFCLLRLGGRGRKGGRQAQPGDSRPSTSSHLPFMSSFAGPSHVSLSSFCYKGSTSIDNRKNH